MADVTRRFLRLIVNGKVAGDLALRAAVEQVRELGHRVDVRVTWEAGDAARYASVHSSRRGPAEETGRELIRRGRGPRKTERSADVARLSDCG